MYSVYCVTDIDVDRNKGGEQEPGANKFVNLICYFSKLLYDIAI
jgi:hypothetical protein